MRNEKARFTVIGLKNEGMIIVNHSGKGNEPHFKAVTVICANVVYVLRHFP